MAELDDDVKEFLTQVYEDLEELDRDLVELEKIPTDEKLLGQIFRAFHTIKGDCGFFGFSKLGNLVHASENLLSRVREGEIPINTNMITALLNVLDAVRQILHQIETTGEQGEQTYPELKAHLNQLKEAKPVPSTPQIVPSEKVAALLTPDDKGDSYDESVPSFNENGALAEHSQNETVSRLVTPVENADDAPSPLEKADQLPSGQNVHTVSSVEKDHLPIEKERDVISDESPDTQKVLTAENDPLCEPAFEKGNISDEHPYVENPIPFDKGSISDSIIRVDVKQLDKLMNLVGELVLTRNQILQLTSKQEHTGLLGASQRLNLITSELQEGIMKTRMQPIKKLWDKFPRLVRDLSIACGKKVIFQMEGEETELDKTLIESISDPLTHLVRNAIDHGLEFPEERIAKGKPAEGHLFLRAFHESGKVNIEVSDDGVGFNPENLREKALQGAFITMAQAKLMTDRELFDLVFLPGFSTAKTVSDISGRGVGLDVVKTNMDKIGGMIDIQSTPNEGTNFKFKLPLTLAIVPALIVKTCGDSFAIPQVSLVELVRLKGKEIQNKIEWIHSAPVYRLRGQLLPLVYLNYELKLNDPFSTNQSPVLEDKSINIIVLQAENRHFGLVVDEVNDTQEIVVKPLGKQLKGLMLYAGVTILGDGRVALILDIMALSQHALLVAEELKQTQLDSQITLEKTSLKSVTATQAQETLSTEMLLLFKTSEQGRMALPLSLVTRLEKFPQAQIECSGNQHVIQYRGQILPLVYLVDVLDGISKNLNNEKDDMLQVIVHSSNNRSVGVVVPRILDIVEESLEVENITSRPGVLYSAIIQGEVTELLDMKKIIQMALPRFFEA